MSHYQHQQPGRSPSQSGTDCSPHEDPAPQPNPPGDDCEPWPPTAPPKLKDPEKCPPDSSCCCPPPPTTGTNCLEDLIAIQAKKSAVAEKAGEFKKALDTLLGQSQKALNTYTRTHYEDLVKEWVRQDGLIAELIRTLVCTVPCWYCVIECHVCPLLYQIHYAEQTLYGDWTLYQDVSNLYDLRYWYSRDLAAKQRRFDRVNAVLSAWGTPYETIGKALGADNTLIGTVSTSVGSDPSKAVYDLFLKLVPMHLAIAPPAGSPWTTKIGKQYTEICACDEGHLDPCCGPDVGVPSLRQRLIGPQPYLIDPNDYFRVICCLVKHRYAPAKDAVTETEIAWKAVDDRIKALETQIPQLLDPKAFETAAKGAIPSTIDCRQYAPPCPDDSPSYRAR